jgi:hypothetical protein
MHGLNTLHFRCTLDTYVHCAYESVHYDHIDACFMFIHGLEGAKVVVNESEQSVKSAQKGVK